ncbi:hypothetical protein Tco_1052319 [Tanacetum coccineum]
MTGNHSRLNNFVKKFIRIVRFGNGHFGTIMGYGDYVIGDSVISKVYYVEGLGHNLFSVRQFCDSDLEVAFRKHSSYVQDTNGVELIKDKMADENVPAPAPTRSDDQILPFAAWVPIKKSNYVLDLQKKQKNPIFHIFVDILQNTNFFRAFTASTSVPAINIQQFWNTLTYEAKTGAYSFELDETKFVLDANLLWEDLEIMPIDQAHQFVSPPSGDAIMDFVNELGYTEGIITSTNVDYVELMWEEFVQDILTFLTDKANLGSPTKKGGKYKAHVIPYCRFTKIIICHLGRTHNIHQRSASLFHLAEEDLRLGNLKFVPKVKEDEVFGMPIPNELISNNIRNAPYYNAYLEMVAKHDQKIAAEKAEKNKPATTKGKVQKLCKGKPSLQLMDEDEPTQPEPEPEHQGEDAETGADTDKTNNGGDTKILQIGEEQGDVVTNVVNLDEKTVEIDEGHAGSDPDPRISSVALAGPDPEPTHDEFMANMYPNVQESLKFLADEHVILEDPLSSTETLSSMKNLEDAYAIGDQFFNEKSTKDEPGKFNVEAEVVSIVNVPIYQASSSVSPLSTPIIDLSPPKPAPSTTQALFFTTTTMTTTTTLPPPPQQQSITESELDAHVTALEKKFFDLEQKNKNLDNTTQNLGSRAVHMTLQAPLQDRFRELHEADMKEILHQRMFKTSTYKSIPEHVALYEALKVSMELAQRDEFFAEKDKFHKRRHDDQDPPPPLPDSDLSKEKT